MTKLVWNENTQYYEGITEDGRYLIQVPWDEFETEKEDCTDDEDWPDAEDYLGDFNDSGAAIVTEIVK